MDNEEVELEIDYYDDNRHVREIDGNLIVVLEPFPDDFVGKIEQEFDLIVVLEPFPDDFVGKIEQEFEEILDKDGKPTGMFEELVFKEIVEEEW